ncbi:MAG TPA: hypothetical protein VGD20_08315, partial [Sphingopyxis sp.]
RFGSDNTAIGENSSAGDGQGHTAIGAFAFANGVNDQVLGLGLHGNTAIGYDTIATGDYSTNTALGRGARAWGSSSSNIAIGDGATAVGDGQFKIGIGYQVGAGGSNSIAIGYNAQVGGNFSVAIGAGSTANEANTFSVGSSANRRRIVNVAPGVVSATSTDAVNGGQLFSVTETADDARLAANRAQNTAEAAQIFAAAAQDTAELALVRADAAQLTANSALMAATQGIDDAATAQVTANAAIANAAAAQATADVAVADNARQDGELAAIRTDNVRQDAAISMAQTTADAAITRSDALGASTATALGGGSVYDTATGSVSAPKYSIGGQSYNNAGSAFAAIDGRLMQVDTRIDVLSESTDRRFRHANGGIAAAMALGGTMIVPDSTVSLSFNLATYRGEQGFSGTVAVRAAPRVYFSGGFAGSTVKGSTGGRVGMAIGF